MDQDDLAFFTSQDLIDELMRRSSFLGIVIHSREEERGGPWPPERTFRVHHNSNLQSHEACRLLRVVADHMDGNLV
jgi:hypothetical protein